MPYVLFFDTETTGRLPKHFNLDRDDKILPHLVQLSMITVSYEKDQYDVVNTNDMIIKPNGWNIPEEAANIHGITNEHALKFGLPLETAVQIFDSILSISTGIVCHNTEYDTRIMGIAYHRCGMQSNKIYSVRSKCTMKSATNVCKLPGKYGFKYPTLTETYKHFFKKEFEGAHDSLNDVRACLDVYKSLKKIGAI